MKILRKSADRGGANHGWLNTRHTFSFAEYRDPQHMGFRSLRVLNEDRVSPGRGFGAHPHRDMEILSYVLGGALQHRDSMGNGSTIRPGDVQRMTAGRGVTHSEANASTTEGVHFLQIWLLPSSLGLAPGYEQKAFSDAEKEGRLRLVASPDGRDGSVTIHADASLWIGRFGTGQAATHDLAPGRHAWVHVARGSATVNGEPMEAGDGLALSAESKVTVEGSSASEVLIFDLG